MSEYKVETKTAHFHLPGLFEFFEFYKVFLPVYEKHREYFYDWCDIGSIYGSPADCIWGGGRFGAEEYNAENVLEMMKKYQISARLTFSNSLLREEHLSDKKCNRICEIFERKDETKNGIIIYSDLLLDYIKQKFPQYYFVSSTTKVLTDFSDFLSEIQSEKFDFVVPDFRLNRQFEKLKILSENEKKKVEFLLNECCFAGCKDRKKCYENVSRRILGENVDEFICKAPDGNEGYCFSKAMKNPTFISVKDIEEIYLPQGFSNFKIEGRGLGSAVVLEMILYYMVKPQFQLNVRERIYLDSMLDLF